MTDKPKYPVVFVHGMFGWGGDEGLNKYVPYWGATTGDLMEYLSGEGFEVYSASCGPVSSAWDRACELYARLTGSTVDYGKAHSRRFGHRRYGREYTEPLFEGWSSEKKVHLVGHSFGGNTVRLLAHLLSFGSPEEIACTDPEELSPLFEGGHDDLILSIVTICAPHNGTPAFEVARKFGLMPIVKGIAYNYCAVAGRSYAEKVRFFDFHLEQFGVSNTPGFKDSLPIFRSKSTFKQSNDNIEYDMSPEGTEKMNRMCRINPELYYFSYAYNAVEKKRKHNFPSKTDFGFLKFTATLILVLGHFSGGNNDYLEYANDGLVNASSALHPKNEPAGNFDGINIKKGLWNMMPIMTGDHGTPIGLFADIDKTHKLYDDMMKLFVKVENLEEKTEK